MTPPLPLDFRTPPAPGEALLRQSDGSWLLLQEPLETRSAWRIEEVLPLLDWAECSVNATSTACDSKANRLFAAGYIAYEAAPAFDPALVCYTPQPTLPLAWWCLYRRAISLEALPPSAQLGPAFLNSRLALREDTATTPSNLPTEWPVDWKPTFDYPRYEQKLTELHGHLHEGNSYQANLCLALEHTADSERRLDRDDLWSFFLRHAPTAPGAIWLETEHRVIASASPELFLDRVGTRLHSKPMKGTRPRGSTPREDCRLARDLASHPKDRAENLMIVDMIRNDLGRIALPGSICTENLFMLERYPTVWQMTSTVVAEVPAAATTCSLLQALFPCASITGAPKVRTSALLRDLEASPRGIYTGSIGQMLPGHNARFNVAIRTLILDKATGIARYGVGSGILHDSDPTSEWAECQAKARLLDTIGSAKLSTGQKGSEDEMEVCLLETIRLYNGHLLLLDEHLERICANALLWGWPCPLRTAHAALVRTLRATPTPNARLRLLLGPQGSCSCELHPENGSAPELSPPTSPELSRQLAWVATLPPLRAILSSESVDSHDPTLRCKTTERARYQAALASAESRGANEALLLNERGELTEGCTANLALLSDTGWLTPRLGCGLLEGTLRRHLLRRGNIPLRPGLLLPSQLHTAQAVALFNSVRGWRRVELLS